MNNTHTDSGFEVPFQIYKPIESVHIKEELRYGNKYRECCHEKSSFLEKLASSITLI